MKTHFLPAHLCKHNRNFTSKDWYSNTWMMSQDINKWWYRITIGSGGRGKTYSGRKLVLKNFKNKGRKFVWLRLTQSAVDNLLQNNAMGLFPVELLRKYNIKVTTKSNAIYLNDKLAGYVASLQGYFNNKGQEFQLHDDYSLKKLIKEEHFTNIGDFDIIADELLREESERNTFDIKHAFQNQIENLVREKTGIRVLIYANFLNDIRDLEELFGITLISGKFGIYRNPKTKTVIEYLEDSEEWASRKKTTYAGVLNVDSGRFSNKAKEENKLIVYNHKLKGYKIAYNIKMGIHSYVVKRHPNGFHAIAHYKGNENNKKTYVLNSKDITTQNHNYNVEIRKHLDTLFSTGKLTFTSYGIYETYLSKR